MKSLNSWSTVKHNQEKHKEFACYVYISQSVIKLTAYAGNYIVAYSWMDEQNSAILIGR